jgi:hypothetical protein
MATARALIVALVAAVLAAPAFGATGDPRVAHTPVGVVAAQKALLQRSDFPKGWKSTPGTAPKSNSLCKNTRPNLSDLTETGYALSPSFAFGQLQAVNQWVRVYKSARQAQTAYSRSVTIGLVSCLAAQLKSASNSKATITIKGQYRLAVPKAAQQADGFRVVAHTKADGGKEVFDVFADVLVLRQGAAVTTVTMTGFIQPVATAFENSLARTIAARLGAKPAGA